MKKIVLVLAVVMFAVPAWEGITISAEQVGDTNVVAIKHEMDSGEAYLPRMLALNISEPFDIYRQLYVYSEFIQISGGQASNYVGQAVLSSPNSMTIEKDLPYASNEPVSMTSESNEMELGGCPCWGDVSDGLMVPPGDGTTVDFGDLNYLIGQLATSPIPWTIKIVDRPDLACADVSDGLVLPPGDGVTIDLGDLSYFIARLSANGWSMPCMWQ